MRLSFARFALAATLSVSSLALFSNASYSFSGFSMHKDAIGTQAVKFVNASTMSAGAQDFVSGLVDRGVGFLGDGSLSTEQKKEEFRKLLHKDFDLKTIGRFTLGTYWKQATPQQRAEYQDLFEKMIVDVYSQRFSEYNFTIIFQM